MVFLQDCQVTALFLLTCDFPPSHVVIYSTYILCEYLILWTFLKVTEPVGKEDSNGPKYIHHHY